MDTTRRSIRLQGYDYRSQGLYYLTICTAAKRCLFGEIIDDSMRLNACGQQVEQAWLETSVKRPYVELDAYVVMPNHFHAILFLRSGTETAPDFPGRGMQRSAGSLSTVIAGFKQAATMAARRTLENNELQVWQRNYYEHIIRTDDSLAQIREYIQNNPLSWALDRENPQFKPDPRTRLAGWQVT
jgi:REP element-mobilizing transposase RayT